MTAPLAYAAALVLDLVAAVVAPPRCAACDAPVRRRSVFCPSCALTAERATPAHDLAAFVYGGAVARAVVRLKYEGRPDLARPLGDLLWSAIAPHADDLRGSVVIPVALHPSRLAERGYNQSALLAVRVASHLGVPLYARALARVHDTPRQATLDRAARLGNVAGAFEVRRPRTIVDRKVLLVDDVRTTGSTLRAASDALLRAGARAVQAAVLAQAE